MPPLKSSREIRGARARQPDPLLPLNVPRPIRVALKEGQPWALRRAEPPTLYVAEIRDCWIVEDRWWEEPERQIDRVYYELLLQIEGNPILCVFHDRIRDVWFEQRVPP